MPDAPIPSRLRWRLRAVAGADLSREQRRDLAEACLRIAPELSNRTIATLSGLSHPTVGSLRTAIYHSPDARNGVVEPDSGGLNWSVTHTSGMATIELERDALVVPVEWLPRRATRRYAGGMVAAVFAATPGLPVPHFIGWLGDVDVDALFESGDIYGVTIRRVSANLRPNGEGREMRAAVGLVSTPAPADRLPRFGGDS